MMQRRWQPLLIPCLLGALLGCAAARRRALVDLSEARLVRAQELRAESVAPAPFQHFQRARAEAQSARVDSPERADHTSEARLWLEVAINQAEQVALAEQRLAVERDNVRLDEAFVELERQRVQLEDESELREAAGIAKLEAERALARAALAPAQRTKLTRVEVERAARSLLQRAELIGLALPPGAVEPAAREQLDGLLREARLVLSTAPDRALSLSDQALFHALSLLGPLRAGPAAPDDAQKASLAEALALIGTRVVRDERGLTASLQAAAPRSVGRLCALARSYPQGPVQVVGKAGRAVASKATLEKLLAEHGCAGERFRVATSGQHTHSLSFTWLAY